MSGTFMLNNRNYTASGNLRLGGDVANPNIADVYDPTQTYNTGDRRIYDDVLYVCNDDNVTGAWDSTKWDSATIDEIISALTAADIPYSAGVSVADKLDTIPNISISSNQNNDVLRYNSSSQKWVNTPLGFKVQEFTKSYTVSANSSLSFSNDFITIPTGYKMFAMLGYSTNDVNVFVPSCRPWDNGAYAFQLMNVRNTSVSNTFYVRIAFVAENWL